MVAIPNARTLPAARAVTSNVMEANLSTVQMRQPAPVSFAQKETGAELTAAAHIAQRIAAFVPVTIGVTNPDITHNSDANDGAAAHGMDCT